MIKTTKAIGLTMLEQAQWTDDKTGEVAKGKLSQDLFNPGIETTDHPQRKVLSREFMITLVVIPWTCTGY